MINEERLDKLESDMMGLHEEVLVNTKLTQEVKASVSELVEIFNSLKGFFKVLGYIGKAAKPMAWVGATMLPLSIWWHDFLEVLKKMFH